MKKYFLWAVFFGVLVLGGLYLQKNSENTPEILENAPETAREAEKTPEIAESAPEAEKTENESEKESEILPEEAKTEEISEETAPEAVLTVDTSKSSWIEAASYEKNDQILTITIKNQPYAYKNVPMSVFEAFSAAESFGSFYNAEIKGQFPLAN